MKMNPQQYTEKLNLSEQLGHVQSLSGKLYVTVAGLRVLAQRADVQTIECAPVWDWCKPDEGVFYVQCSVTMPGDRLFVEYGSSHGSPVGKRGGNHAMLGHACTRATGRALRLALEVELPLFEESGHDQQRPVTNQSQPKQPKQPKLDKREKAKIAISRAQNRKALSEVWEQITKDFPNDKDLQGKKYCREQWLDMRDDIASADSIGRLDTLGKTISGNRAKYGGINELQALREIYKARRAEVAKSPAKITDQQRKKLFAMLKEKGISHEEHKKVIDACFGVSSHNDLQSADVAKMIDALGREPNDAEKAESHKMRDMKYLAVGCSYWSALLWTLERQA